MRSPNACILVRLSAIVSIVGTAAYNKGTEANVNQLTFSKGVF
jgi:hypothetical protein